MKVTERKKRNNGFTIIELLISVGLLVMVIGVASMIFRMSVDAFRKASANAEIMANFRAITTQLKEDFKGFQEGTLSIKWENPASDVDYEGTPMDLRYDKMTFVLNGDFQSTLQYGPDDETIHGNIASICYSLAPGPDPLGNDKTNKILVRRQTILVADEDSYDVPDPNNEFGEYTFMSFAEWKADDAHDPDNQTWVDEWSDDQYLSIDEDEGTDIVMYMAEGVDNFQIQYINDTEIGYEFDEWRPTFEELDTNYSSWEDKVPDVDALKISFTLYDSKGILEKGKRFSYIVYLGN